MSQWDELFWDVPESVIDGQVYKAGSKLWTGPFLPHEHSGHDRVHKPIAIVPMGFPLQYAPDAEDMWIPDAVAPRPLRNRRVEVLWGCGQGTHRTGR